MSLTIRVKLNDQEHLGAMTITQTGPGASGGTHRDYDVCVSWKPMGKLHSEFRRCRVKDHDREQAVWSLILRAIEEMGF